MGLWATNRSGGVEFSGFVERAGMLRAMEHLVTTLISFTIVRPAPVHTCMHCGIFAVVGGMRGISISRLSCQIFAGGHFTTKIGILVSACKWSMVWVWVSIQIDDTSVYHPWASGYLETCMTSTTLEMHRVEVTTFGFSLVIYKQVSIIRCIASAHGIGPGMLSMS